MIATSSAYSRPQYRPSSPSAAASTVNPASSSCETIESRRAFSSSTIRMRMRSVHRPRLCVDPYGPDLAFGAQQTDLMHAAVSVAHRLCPHGLRAVAPLRHFDGLVQRD